MQVGWISLLTIAGGFATFVSIAPPAQATSTVLAPVSHAATCTVAAEFLGPRRKENRIAWRYRRVSAAETALCRNAGEEFEVWIPGGGYSTLSNSIVYPAHIVEPKVGQRFSLRLIRSEKPVPGWYVSGPYPRPEEYRK